MLKIRYQAHVHERLRNLPLEHLLIGESILLAISPNVGWIVVQYWILRFSTFPTIWFYHFSVRVCMVRNRGGLNINYSFCSSKYR